MLLLSKFNKGAHEIDKKGKLFEVAGTDDIIV